MKLSPIFSSKSFTILVLMFRSLIHFKKFLCKIVYCKDPTLFFCIEISNFPNIICQRNCPFPSDSILVSQLWSIWPYVWGFISGLSSLFIGLYITIFMPIPHCFNYYSFVVKFEVRKSDIPIFSFFFKIIVALCGPLRFHMNFRIKELIFIEYVFSPKHCWQWKDEVG